MQDWLDTSTRQAVSPVRHRAGNYTSVLTAIRCVHADRKLKQYYRDIKSGTKQNAQAAGKGAAATFAAVLGPENGALLLLLQARQLS